MAIKCCQDNDKAFYNHKEKKLFPTTGATSILKVEAEKNKAIINAFKSV